MSFGRLVRLNTNGSKEKVEGARTAAAISSSRYGLAIKVSEDKPCIEDNIAILSRKNEYRQTGAYHGLYRTLVNNMIIGVSQGFSKSLLINGVGYRAEVNGQSLLLNLGFSNQIEYQVTDGLTVTCEGTNKVIVSGIDKQKVGQASAEIRSLRPPEPYKGKGIRYENETVKRKIGKAGIK